MHERLWDQTDASRSAVQPRVPRPLRRQVAQEQQDLPDLSRRRLGDQQPIKLEYRANQWTITPTMMADPTLRTEV